MNTTQNKIPGWRLPGAVGWDGFRPNEIERSVESSAAKLVLPAIGSLNFEMPVKIAATAVQEIPGAFEAIGSLFTSDILQIKKAPTPVAEKQQEQKTEFSFRRERFQMQTANVREAKITASQELEETTLRITKGQMGVAEVKAISSTTEIGISHVFSIWAKKQEQAKAAAQSQEEKNVASTNRKGFTMGENEMLKGGENQHHFTQVAG